MSVRRMERAVPVLPADSQVVAKEFYAAYYGCQGTSPGARERLPLLDPFGNTIFVIGPTRE